MVGRVRRCIRQDKFGLVRLFIVYVVEVLSGYLIFPLTQQIIFFVRTYLVQVLSVD
jgi:hypothetical protein